MPKPEIPKADVESVLAEFDKKRDTLAVFGDKTKDLIQDFLQYGKVRHQSVQARVKTKEKLKNKYLDPTKNYTGLQDITDTPEPTSLLLFGTGLLGVLGAARRK